MVDASRITKETGGSGGSFAYSRNGDTARLSWSTTSPTLVIAASTHVPDSMRGEGVGDALLSALIADARAGHYRIVPLCPFVKARGPLHADWADVVAR